MPIDTSWLLYGGLMVSIWGIYAFFKNRGEAETIAMKQAAIDAGLAEPVSLHPLIDTSKCLGCATCVRACPEQTVLGIIAGKAELIEPSHCIGHGACATACPTKAITLVFGTAKRGLDIPQVGPDFQTNVPGIFIAGELGGMGLIRNAVQQGRQAVEAAAKRGRASGQALDLIIVGAGPAGLAGALAAKAAGLRYTVIEQDDLGGAVFKYPRSKIVMTAPFNLPIVGPVKFRETTKEALLQFWKGVEAREQLHVRYRERVDHIERAGEFIDVHTTAGKLSCMSLLLAIGRRGTPRKLGVAGEDLPKVVYQLIDAEQYRGMNVFVVGGGDSALEAACTIAEQPGTAVILSYRNTAFSRAKPKNRDRLERMRHAGRLTVLMPSNIISIAPDSVEIESAGRREKFANDAVIICAGGALPTDFLARTGIAMETKYGTA